MMDFLKLHFDTMITVLITVLGFIITYFMTKRNFEDEITKYKITHTAEAIQSLPYDICQMMDSMIRNKKGLLEEYGKILSRVLAYGSKDAVSIAICMQQLSYTLNDRPDDERFSVLAAYALLITQLKYDLTSEIISPESWFQLRMTDYSKMQSYMKSTINDLVLELDLNTSFLV